MERKREPSACDDLDIYLMRMQEGLVFTLMMKPLFLVLILTLKDDMVMFI